ncbi:hypothetical protein BA898_05515 [Spiribacter roseus]|nr:hypothetical protein BA898_05515 [Spiribacter roseus]
MDNDLSNRQSAGSLASFAHGGLRDGGLVQSVRDAVTLVLGSLAAVQALEVALAATETLHALIGLYQPFVKAIPFGESSLGLFLAGGNGLRTLSLLSLQLCQGIPQFFTALPTALSLLPLGADEFFLLLGRIDSPFPFSEFVLAGLGLMQTALQVRYDPFLAHSGQIPFHLSDTITVSSFLCELVLRYLAGLIRSLKTSLSIFELASGSAGLGPEPIPLAAKVVQ